jgi:hypothetical protein
MLQLLHPAVAEKPRVHRPEKAEARPKQHLPNEVAVA